MANTLLIKRGTSANLVTLAASNGLKVGELYFLTDTKILAVGLTTNTYVAYNADSIPEGSTNLYFTGSRVLNTVLAGLSTVTNAAVTASDTILVAFGKLQKQFTDHFGTGGSSHPEVTTSVNGFMSAADKVKLDGLSGGGGGGPAGNTREVQYNNAGTMAGAGNVEIDNNDLILMANASPVTPPAGYIKLFGRTIANRVMVASVGSSGFDSIVQPAFFRQKIGIWSPPGNSTAVPGISGLPNFTTTGTATSRSVTTANLFTRTKRLGYVSAATAYAVSGHRVTVAQYTTGNGAGLGGFFYACRFGFSDASNVTGARAFVGMSSTTAAPSNVEPTILNNSIGIAQLSTDATQLYLVYGGAAASTAIALGVNFPPKNGTGATNGIVYELSLFSPPNLNGVVHYRVERIGTSFTAEGTLTPITVGVQTPASTTLLAHRAWRTNNATAAAVGIDIISVYIETDY